MIIYEQFILIIYFKFYFLLKKQKNAKNYFLIIIFYIFSYSSCIYKRKLFVRRKTYMDISCI